MIEKIKAIKWDKRVTRAGFIQSKQIVSEACITKVNLTENISVKYDNNMWADDLCLYDEDQTNVFLQYFEQAFEEDSEWPKKIVNIFDLFLPLVNKLIKNLRKKNINKKEIFLEYVKILISIQKDYTFAVPLTNYCESKIKDSALINAYAVPYKPLELEEMQESLNKIKTQEDIDDHIKKYSWIKTSYNIIQEYTVEDVKSELKQSLERQEFDKPEIPKALKPYVLGLQIGIYLRNRMKELSQKLWFSVENLGCSIAKDLNISRDDFFQLTYKEVIASIEKGECIVSKEDFKERHKGIIIGFMDNYEVFKAGKEAGKLFDYYNKPVEDVGEIKGMVACKGFVTGNVQVVLNIKSFKNFQEGNILITRMTTPDFVPLMKKAKAIVTDEGGLSCHAAIVSRELGIPCVIGTKDATKVFKDGDMIEVDANNGVVRRLNE